MKRNDSEFRDTNCQTAGECLLRLGHLARFLVRHGSRIDQIARELHVGPRVCMLSLAFVTAPDWVKLRALVENWNALHIRTCLRSLQERLPI